MGRVAACTLVLLLACVSCREDGDLGRDAVQVHVARVALDARTESPVVILEENGGGRQLPIWIGAPEASSIASELESARSPRPNSHDLAKRLIDGLEGSVARVVVTHLSDGVYYARIVLTRRGHTVDVDARPSDAIAIALRYQAPLYVHGSLLREAMEAAGADAGSRI